MTREAIDLGVNFIDTANAYGDSEEKIGEAIKGVNRDRLIIASKSTATDKKTFLRHLDLCLKRLGSDYVDLYQTHNVSSPETRDAIFASGGAFEGLTEAVRQGKVRFPAFSSHNIPLAVELMKTGLFASVQLPFNFVDDAAAEEAIPLAKKLDMGFICMKPFGGGLLDNAGLAIRYLLRFENIVPDPGIEKIAEIREIVAIVNENKPLSAEDEKTISGLKSELGKWWCHRCDYCQPCPQGIPISSALTLRSLIKRGDFDFVFRLASAGMEKARSCLECGECVKRCPYKLDIPRLLKKQITLWEETLRARAG